jgi:hypothetical protein
LQDDGRAVIERVRLPLAALFPAQVKDVARVLSGLGLGDLGSLVRARVVDQVDPQGVPRVLKRHEPVDRGADDRRFVPGRDQDRGPREHGRAVLVVITPVMTGDQQKLPARGDIGDGAEHDQDDEDPVAALEEVAAHGGQIPAALTVCRTEL